MTTTYLFTSKRLGFRNWETTDLPDFAAMNADAEVMKHFPETLTAAESAAFMERLQQRYQRDGYTYYAVDILATGEWIGFIGIAYQDYEAVFNPATDIGWRLKQAAWGKGYATEGAKRCLDYAFETLKLEKIVAVCVCDNQPSENVMQKIGMTKKGYFKHPKLVDYPALEDCIWYEGSKSKLPSKHHE